MFSTRFDNGSGHVSISGNSGEMVTQAGCEQCGLNAIMLPVATICEQYGLKPQDHMPYPSNDQKM
jgi:hypothetical protein